MGIAITSACFIMVTIGIFSLLMPSRSNTSSYSNNMGMVRGAGGQGCLVILLGPGAIFATVTLILKDLDPTYSLALAAMVGSFLALSLPLLFLIELGGVESVLALPEKLARGEEGIVGRRSAPLGLLSQAMKVEPPADPQGGYREAPDWASYESELTRAVEGYALRYRVLIFLSMAFALLVVPAVVAQVFVIGGFDSLAIKVFAVLGGTCSLGFGLALLAHRQLARAVAGIPGAVLTVRKAYPDFGAEKKKGNKG